jgi:hypothetical protein
MEELSIKRRLGRARIPAPAARQRRGGDLRLAPILVEQLVYLIDHAEEESDRYERVATILMERFQ